MSKYTYSDPTRRMQRVKDDLAKNDAPFAKVERIKSALRGENLAMTNRFWEVLTYFLPHLVHQNPRLSVTSALPGESRSDAVGLKYALETLMEQQRWANVWKQMAADALAWRGVGMVTETSVALPRYMDGQEFLRWDGKKMVFDRAGGMTVPRISYVPMDKFFRDCTSATTDEARHMGHQWDDDIDRLAALAEEDETWDKDEIERMRSTRQTSTLDERRVTLTQVYCPFYIDQAAVDAYDGDEDPEDRDLFTGTIYTMSEALNGGGLDIKKPMLYRGPTGGLYTVLDYVNAPGMRERMAPFSAALQQVDNDAVVSRALMRSIKAYKRVAVATETIAQAITTSVNDGVVSLKVAAEDIQKQLYELTIGGPSPELLKGYELSDMACDRTLSFSDSLRGNAGSDTTATAETYAKTSSDARLGSMADCANDAMEKMCSVAAWYIEHAQDFGIRLPSEAVEAGISDLRDAGLPIPEGLHGLDPISRELVVYRGGDALDRSPDGMARHAFDGKTVKVVPMSAQRTSEALQQQRTMQTTELLFRALEVQQAIPNFKAKRLLNDIGAQLNVPGLGGYVPEEPQPAPGQQGQQQGTPQPQAPSMPGRAAGQMVRT